MTALLAAMTSASRLLGVVAAVLATLPIFSQRVDAQVTGPTPWTKSVYAMAFASTNTHLFIQGGLTRFSMEVRDRSTEYFKLDLSVNWTTDNPAWTSLKTTSTDLPISGLSGAILPNGGMAVRGLSPTLLLEAAAGTIDNQRVFKPLSFTTQLVNFPIRSGYAVAASPEGDIYVLSEGRTQSSTSSVVGKFPSQTDTIAAVWCPSLGAGGAVLTTKLTGSTASFTWLNGVKWEILSIVQEPVPAVYGHCLVKGDTDDKYYLFGGASQGNLEASSGQLYVIEMKSGSMTKLGKPTGKRAYMACAATKESFFAWGGMSDGGRLANTTPLIFNFAAGDWVDRNIITPPPPPPLPPPVIPPNPDNPDAGNGNGTNPGPGGNNNGNGNGGNGNGGNGKGNNNNGNGGAGNGGGDDSGSGSSQLNIAAIAGGAGGGIALIALVALFFFVGRKRRKSSKYDDWKYSSKRSSPRDDYSRRDRRDSRSSDSEKEYSSRRPEPLSAMHSEKEPPSKPLRKKRSSSSLRESDRDYNSREQAEPLRHNSNSDHELGPSKSKGQAGSSRYNGPGASAAIAHNDRDRDADPSITSLSTNRTLQGSSEGGPGRQQQSSNRMPGGRTSAQQSPRQQSGSLIPGSPIAGGSQYGGSQFGGSHHGGSQHGGSQHGGSQYGGSQFSSSQSGRSHSSSQRALLASPPHQPMQQSGRTLSSEEQHRLLQSPSDRANRIPSLGQTHTLPVPGGPNRPRNGARENVGRGLSLHNLRPAPQPYAPRDDDIPDHYRILLAPADTASSTTNSIIYSPSIASERTMELVPMNDHDASSSYSSAGPDHLRSPPIRNGNSARDYPRSRLHIVDQPNHDDDAESHDGSMRYI